MEVVTIELSTVASCKAVIIAKDSSDNRLILYFRCDWSCYIARDVECVLIRLWLMCREYFLTSVNNCSDIRAAADVLNSDFIDESIKEIICDVLSVSCDVCLLRILIDLSLVDAEELTVHFEDVLNYDIF